MKQSIDDIDVHGRRVLVRLDLNVPTDGQGRITDDRRIRSALPTLRRLLDGGGRLVLMSHFGRPKGGVDDRTKFSLASVAKKMGERLSRPVTLLGDCVGPDVRDATASMNNGDVILLENLRFHPEETIKDSHARDNQELRGAKDAFARQLAAMGDVYVNDAFGTCHRDNASMFTVPRLMDGKPRVAGYLVQRELELLGGAMQTPARPFVCILGGAKVSDKLGVIRSLMESCDTILIGGAMAYTYLAAEGLEVGRSLVEPELFSTARELRASAGDRLRLPVDSVAASEMRLGVETMVCDGAIPDDRMGLDIGPATIQNFREVVLDAKTIVWNGPMGVFEVPPFDTGTFELAAAVAQATDRGATTIVGGGDSAAAVEKAGLADRVTHISTGGGATLRLLEGKPLVAIDALDDKP